MVLHKLFHHRILKEAVFVRMNYLGVKLKNMICSAIKLIFLEQCKEAWNMRLVRGFFLYMLPMRHVKVFHKPQPGFKPFGFSAQFNTQALLSTNFKQNLTGTKTHEVLFPELNNSEIFLFNQNFKLRNFQTTKHMKITQLFFTNGPR